MTILKTRIFILITAITAILISVPWILQSLILAFCIAICIAAGLVRCRRYFGEGCGSHERAIAVIVLGDVGRSPRMQNHALAIRRLMTLTPVQQRDKWESSKRTTGNRSGTQPSGVKTVRPLSYRAVLIGYRGSKCCSEVENDSQIEIVRLSDPIIEQWRPQCLKFGRVGFLVFAVFKMIDVSIRLCHALLMIPSLRSIIVQNPPTFPTLPLMWAFCRISGTRFLVDWHNYGTSILALSPVGRLFCAVSKCVEKGFGRLADHAFCVSEAMRRDLISNWGVPASCLSLLYDKPPSSFHLLSLVERHEILLRYFPKNSELQWELNPPITSAFGVSSQPHITTNLRQIVFTVDGVNFKSDASDAGDTLNTLPCYTQLAGPLVLRFSEGVEDEISMFTELRRLGSSHDSELRHLDSRPALIVTSTSWTPDEDLDLLLESLCMYDAEVNSKKVIPDLVVVVTGIGPGRMAWLEKATKMKMMHVKIKSVFLPFDDYWRLLGAADLGICLHTSSSGLDLPMKAVDMRGVGLPILAVSYPALTELVIPGVSGELFQTAEELSRRLITVLSGFPSDARLLLKLRLACEGAKLLNWDVEWQEQALPVLRESG